MWDKIKKFLWLLICESDERYPDLVRIGLLLSILSAIGVGIYFAVVNAEFDVVEFCSGLAGLLFGGGVGVGARARLEDGKTNDQTVAGIKSDKESRVMPNTDLP